MRLQEYGPLNPLRVLWHLKTEVVSASLIDLPMFYFVLFLLACSQARTETAAVATVTQQAEDSVARAVIPPEGGTVALAGFATVIFPPQAFDAPREVTVEATTLPTTRRIIHLSMLLARSAPALGHEIRVTTGASPPAREIDVCVNVPAEYVSGLPSDHTVALYAQEVTGGPEESIERFRRFPSEFDVQAGAVRAQLPARVFDDLQRLPGRFEAVVAIGSRPELASVLQQPADSVATAVIPPDGGTVALAGFAMVVFPAGAFDAPRQVTVEATSEPSERVTFRFVYRAPPAAHEIRVTTGETPPTTGIQVALDVPEAFLNELPADRTVDLYVLAIGGGPDEDRIDEYVRLPSEFDAQAKVVRAEVPNRFFARFRGPGGGDPGRSRRNEVVIMIGSVPKR